MKRLLTWSLCALATCWTLNAAGQVPERIQYQGILKTAAGTPVDCATELDCPGGPYTMTMRLYDAPSGGVPLWEETHENVAVSNGVFRLTLGGMEPLVGDTLPNALWLGIVINGGTESSPRQQVVSSAFALRANEAGIALDADALGGISAESYATKDELPGLCVTAAVLSEALTTLSDEAPYFTAADVEVVLVDGGYVTLTDLTAVALTGSYLDLSDTPAVLDSLSVNDGGDLVFAGTPLINAAGEWIGPPTGLTGPQGEKGADGAAGLDGISVVSAEVNSAGELVIVLSDGTITTSAPLTGPKGADGAVGPPGVDGVSGLDGISVASAEVNSAGELVIVLSDGTMTTSASLKGPMGEKGAQGDVGPAGADGAPGIPGLDGVSVTSAEVNSAGELVIVLSDGTIQTSPSLVGPQGPQGAQGIQGVKGDKGEQGDPGIQGVTGAMGPSGADGAPGIPGLDGLDGVSVSSAEVTSLGELVIVLSNGTTTKSAPLIGPMGPEGPSGAQGIQGVKGDKGEPGIQGSQGIPGLAGQVGPAGADGAPGIPGLDGLDGVSVSSAEVTSLGELVVVLSDGTITKSAPLMGPMGPQGNPGAQGIQGIKGDKGDTGAQGIQGLKGDTGAQGLPGIQGATGPAGADGAAGADGVSITSAEVNSSGELVVVLSDGTSTTSAPLFGPTGAQGIQGIQGVKGDKGDTGAQGIQGLKGDTGAQGLPGIQGATGPAGADGAAGADGVSITSAEVNSSGELVVVLSDGTSTTSAPLFGPTGAQGIQGIQGIKGDKGDTGAQGIQGLKGDTGAQGATGIQGDTGAAGADGVSITSAEVNSSGELVVVLSDGTSTTSAPLFGPTGAQGIQGIQGVKGDKGDTGAQGIQGLKGDTGAQGLPGIQGDTGAAGADGVSITSAEVNSSGELVVVLSDGTSTTSDPLVGPTGAQGLQGTQGIQGIQGVKGDTGAQGLPGIPGTAGADGVSVVSAIVNGSSQLVVTLSDGSTFVSGSLKGATGETGATGSDGAVGPAGSLAAFSCDEGQVLVSTGSDWECGDLTGGGGGGASCTPECPDTSTQVCGESISDGCGGACAAGTGLNITLCPAVDTLTCGEPAVDACGNACGYQGDPCPGTGDVEWEFVIHPADNSESYWKSAVGPDGSLYLLARGNGSNGQVNMNGSNFNSNYKTYLAKITPDGNLDWIQPLYNTVDSFHLHVGDDGSVLVAFSMSKTISQLGMFAPCAYTIGVARFSPEGNLEWSETIGETSECTSWAAPRAITQGPDGGAYLSIYINNWGWNPTINGSLLKWFGHVLIYLDGTQNGTAQWFYPLWEGEPKELIEQSDGSVKAVIGNAFYHFNSTGAKLGSTSMSGWSPYTDWDTNSRLNPISGETPAVWGREGIAGAPFVGGVWADSLNAVGDGGLGDNAAGSAPDGSSIFAAEFIQVSIDFGSGIINNLAYSNLFVRAYDPWGNLKWDKIIMESNSPNLHHLSMLPDGSSYLRGYHTGPFTFDGTSVPTLGSSYNWHIIKMAP